MKNFNFILNRERKKKFFDQFLISLFLLIGMKVNHLTWNNNIMVDKIMITQAHKISKWWETVKKERDPTIKEATIESMEEELQEADKELEEITTRIWTNKICNKIHNNSNVTNKISNNMEITNKWTTKEFLLE